MRQWHVGIQVSPMHDVGIGPRLCRTLGVLVLGMQINERRADILYLRFGLTDSSLAQVWERDGPAPGAVGKFVFMYSNDMHMQNILKRSSSASRPSL